MAYKKSKKQAAKKSAKKTGPKPAKKVVAKTAETENPKAAKPKRPKKAKTKKPKSEHYVNGKEFLQRIKDYYDTDNLVDELSIMVVKIANGLSYAPNFINYSYKDEMIGDAILKMFSALKNKKFDVSTNNNPFSYFTTVAYHAFINRIKKEKKHHETIQKYQETVYDDKMSDSGAHIKPTCKGSDDMFTSGDE